MKINCLIKVSICLFIIIAAGVRPSFCQSNDAEGVKQRVEELRTAMLLADTSQLSNLVSNNLTYGHSSGKVETKKQFLESISSGASAFADLKFTDTSITITANTAVVRHIFTASTKDKGKEPGLVKLSVLLVWVKGKGNWQLLARQAVKINQ